MRRNGRTANDATDAQFRGFLEPRGRVANLAGRILGGLLPSPEQSAQIKGALTPEVMGKLEDKRRQLDELGLGLAEGWGLIP